MADVKLNLYNITENPQFEKLNKVLTAVGTGAFHGGVEVYGKEYSFGFAQDGSGVFSNPPRGRTLHQFRESLSMGKTQLTKREVEQLIERLREEWQGKDYDMLRRNCVSFSEQFIADLGVGPVPTWVTNLAAAGATVQDGAMAAVSKAQAAAIVAAAKAGEIDEKYNVTGTTQSKVQELLAVAQAADDKYDIQGKVEKGKAKGKELAGMFVLKVQELDAKHDIKGKTAAAAAQAQAKAMEASAKAQRKAQSSGCCAGVQ